MMTRDGVVSERPEGIGVLDHAGSRGKGKRRSPGRDGGARKKQTPTWHKQAAHAAESLAALPKPVVTLPYYGDHYKNPGERIYVLDQLLSKARIPYFPAQSSQWAFTITVPEENRPPSPP